MAPASPPYDVTRPLAAGTPVWPGDAPFRLTWTARVEEGAPANVSELCLSAHCGTHVDAPLHVRSGGRAIGEMALAAFLGPARVVDARDRDGIDAALVAKALAGERVERILFHTGCWADPRTFPTRFAALAPEAAWLLREAGVLLVGTDAPSVDPYDAADLTAHRVLGEGEIAIVENLLLDGVPAGDYELVALPLRLAGADASPLRAVLLPR